jgi:hypothetical protein
MPAGRPKEKESIKRINCKIDKKAMQKLESYCAKKGVGKTATLEGFMRVFFDTEKKYKLEFVRDIPVLPKCHGYSNLDMKLDGELYTKMCIFLRKYSNLPFEKGEEGHSKISKAQFFEKLIDTYAK